jgi:hypothetical protein
MFHHRTEREQPIFPKIAGDGSAGRCRDKAARLQSNRRFADVRFVSTAAPEQGDAPGEQIPKKRRDSRLALVLGYLVTGVLFVGATGLDWAVAVVGLVGAGIVRAVYVGLRNRRGGNRPFLSPWALLLASFFAALSLAGTRASEQDDADNSATSACTAGVMQNFDDLAPAGRRFSRTDFEKYASRFCAEAIDRGLATGDGTNRAKLVALRESLIASMLKSGEIHEL